MGLTTAGSIGAKTALTLDQSVKRVQAISDAARDVNPDVLVLCHGGKPYARRFEPSSIWIIDWFTYPELLKFCLDTLSVDVNSPTL